MEKDIFSNLFEVIFVQLECLFGIDNIPLGLVKKSNSISSFTWFPEQSFLNPNELEVYIGQNKTN
jgi:hypothetical protein